MAQQMEEATKMDWKKKSEEALKIAKRFRLETIIEQWKEIIDA
jgi:hypothetical protein